MLALSNKSRVCNTIFLPTLISIMEEYFCSCDVIKHRNKFSPSGYSTRPDIHQITEYHQYMRFQVHPDAALQSAYKLAVQSFHGGNAEVLVGQPEYL